MKRNFYIDKTQMYHVNILKFISNFQMFKTPNEVKLGKKQDF